MGSHNTYTFCYYHEILISRLVSRVVPGTKEKNIHLSLSFMDVVKGD
jgi:hypothetical protein